MRVPLILLFVVCQVLAVTGCGDRKKTVLWDMEVKGTENGVLMELTGVTILFSDTTMERPATRKIKIHDPGAAGDTSGMQMSIEGWSEPVKPGNPELGVSYSSPPETCRIKLGRHTVIIQDKGEKIEIDKHQFGINPAERPHFVVSIRDGKTVVTREEQDSN